MEKHRILFVGLGDLGAQIFDLLVRLPGNHRFLVGGTTHVLSPEKSRQTGYGII